MRRRSWRRMRRMWGRRRRKTKTKTKERDPRQGGHRDL
jgi:hypothetical protein